MVRAVEANDGRPQQTEIRERSLASNRFVSFLDQNRETIGLFYEAESQFKEERMGWILSEAFQQEIKAHTDIYIKELIISDKNLDEARLRRSQRDWLISKIFYIDPDQAKKEDINLLNSVPETISKKATDLSKSKLEGLAFFIDAYEETIKPLYDERKKQKIITLGLVSDFLLEGLNNFADFEEFLSSPEFQLLRADNRTLLALVEEHEKDKNRQTPTLDKIASTIKTAEIQNPNPLTFEEFIKNRPPKGNSDMWQWIEFAVRIAGSEGEETQKKELAQIVEILLNNQPLPQTLTQEYSRFISQILNSSTLRIQRILYTYAPKIKTTDVYVPTPNRAAIRISLRKGGIPHTASKIYLPEEDLESIEPNEKPLYEVGLLHRDSTSTASAEMSEDALERFIQRASTKLARGDLRMLNDIRKMVESVRKEPIGPDNALISFQTLNIEGKKNHPRRFRPANQETWQHDLTSNLRLVFYVDHNENGQKRVLIEDVYRHEDYEAKFAMKGF